MFVTNLYSSNLEVCIALEQFNLESFTNVYETTKKTEIILLTLHIHFE